MTNSPPVLCIAGVSFSFTPQASSAPIAYPLAYLPFLSALGSSRPELDATFHILPADNPSLEPMDGPPSWSNEVWRMGPGAGGQIIEIYNVIRSRWTPVANIADDFGSGRIQPFHGRRAEPSSYFLNYPYDQAILVNRLLRRDVVIVHGAGILFEGRGYVFFGPSGIGKTTISRLWQSRGAVLLNDDRVALRRDATGQWFLAGTPWHGEEPRVSPLQAPLGGIIRLRQSNVNHLRPMQDTEGISELIACALLPFFSREALEGALDLLSGLPQEVAVAEFSFRPDLAALDYFVQQLSPAGRT